MIEGGVLASNGKLLCACLQSALQSAVVLRVSRPSEHQTPRGEMKQRSIADRPRLIQVRLGRQNPKTRFPVHAWAEVFDFLQ